MTLLVVLSLMFWGSNRPPACRVDATPKVTFAPLRALHIKVTVEPDAANRTLTTVLVGPEGLVRSSEEALDGDQAARTRWVDWKNLAEGAGTYDVRILVNGSNCSAVDHIEVQG